MKKILSSAILTMVIVFGLTAQAQTETGTETAYKKVKLANPKFEIPADNGVVGWQAFNRDWPGKLEIMETAEDGKFLRITPLPSPTQKTADGNPRTLVMVRATPAFKAEVGKKVKIKFEFRLETTKISGAPQLYGPRMIQYPPSFRAMKPAAGKWNAYAAEYTIKPLKDKSTSGSFSLGFNIENNTLDIRNVSLAVEK